MTVAAPNATTPEAESTSSPARTCSIGFSVPSAIVDQRPLDQALVRVADREHVPVLAGEELQEPVLRVVRVLVLVDEDVAEGVLPVRAGLGESLEHPTVSISMSSKSTAFEAASRRWYCSYTSATVWS